MTAEILDGKALAKKIRDNLRDEVSKLSEKPGLGVIMVGEDPASQIYVRGKERACADVGIVSKKVVLDSNITQQDLMKVVDEFNTDQNIHGFIVQLPLPKQIDSQAIIDGILPSKDADGFSPINLGNLLIGRNTKIPATPKGIMRLLEEYNINLQGKHAVVIGRSNIVGKPISLLLQQKHATVVMCHSRTNDLKKITKDADMVVVAVGQAGLLTKDMVKPGAIVVDVGMCRTEDGGLCGDVDYDSVSKVASYITPVPGGVGPLTIAMLLENTMECYKRHL